MKSNKIYDKYKNLFVNMYRNDKSKTTLTNQDVRKILTKNAFEIMKSNTYEYSKQSSTYSPELQMREKTKE